MNSTLVDLEKFKPRKTYQAYNAGFVLDDFKLPHEYSIEIAVWYPSYQEEKPYKYLPYIKGLVSESSEIINKKFPLVVLSSGYAGTFYDQSYIAESLARNGYLVLSVSHSFFDKGNELGCGRAWYRSFEIKKAIDYIYSSTFSKYILDGVSLLGFSAGGFSSLLLTGAVPSFQLDEDFVPYLSNLKNLDFSLLYDDRIKNLCLFAPALGTVFIESELKKIGQKVMLITAEKDEVLFNTTEQYQRHIPNLVVNRKVKDAGHFVFNSVVSTLMKKLYPETCVDVGVDRHIVHPFLIGETIEFLNNSLNYYVCEENCG